jgi:hypothetical protein
MKLRSSFVFLTALSAFGAALGGCASPASTEVESDAAPSTIEAVVHVERTSSPVGTSTSVSAKFLRVLPDDAEKAASLVGTRAVIPAEGDCAPISSLTPRRPVLKGSVDLVDVGDVVLRARAAEGATPSENRPRPLELQLTPRAFPDVGDIVSGVFYTQPDVASDSGDLPSPGAYLLSGTGASLVEPFSFDVSAPATPANVRVVNQPLVASPGEASKLPAVAVGKDLGVEWDVDGPTDGLVYVDVMGASPFRCAFKDTGSAVVPSDVLSRDDAGHEVSVSVHRVREENLRLDLSEHEGQEAAIVRFDFARAGRLSVE